MRRVGSTLVSGRFVAGAALAVATARCEGALRFGGLGLCPHATSKSATPKCFLKVERKSYSALGTQFGGTGRASCCMSQVMAGLGDVPFTRPVLATQVRPTIQPQIVMPLTAAVFQNTGKCDW